MQQIDIRNGLRAGHIFPIVVQLGIGLPLLAVAAYGSVRGSAPPGPLVTAWLGGLGLSAMGAFHLARAMDRQVKLSLSPAGLLDHRSGGVLVPWSAVQRIISHGQGVNILDLALSADLMVGTDAMSAAGNLGGNPRLIRVPLDELDTNLREMIRLIHRFAPQLR